MKAVLQRKEKAMTKMVKDGSKKQSCPPARFVEIWQTSDSVGEVCDRIEGEGFSPVTEETVKLRASQYRRKGIPSLKRFPASRGRRGKIDFSELEKIARKALRAA